MAGVLVGPRRAARVIALLRSASGEDAGSGDDHVGPAAATTSTLAALIPPSTSISTWPRPWSSRSRRSFRILGSTPWMKDWPAKPGLDGHQQDHRDVGEDMLDGAERGGRIEGHRGPLAGGLDPLPAPDAVGGRPRHAPR